jgi:hypothetical protein
MSLFGDDHEDANELYDQMKQIVEDKGLAYLIEYLGKCLEWIGDTSSDDIPF